jgi:hypothetical protein
MGIGITTGQKLNSGSPRPMNWARDDDLAQQSSFMSSSEIYDIEI